MTPLGYESFKPDEPEAPAEDGTAKVIVEFATGQRVEVPVALSVLREAPDAPIRVALETLDSDQFG
jgi:hypothetical protein